MKSTLPNLFPAFAQQLTLGGIELLGRSLNLDPRITQLIGLPIAAAIGGTVSYMMHPGGTATLWQTIRDAVFNRSMVETVLSIGVDFVIETLELDQSLLGSLSGRLIAGLFNDFLSSPTRFNFVDSIIKSVDESFFDFFDLASLPVLIAAIMDHGLAEGIEQYATQLFTRETLNEFVSAGMNLGQWIATGIPTADDIVYQGEAAKRLHLTQNGKTINFIYQPQGEKLQLLMIYEEYSDGRKPRLIEFATDDQGKITQVLVTEQMTDGTFNQVVMTPTGAIQEVTFRDWNNNAYGRVSFNSNGDIEFTNYNLGISNYLTAKGEFHFDFILAPDFQDFNQLLFDFNASQDPEKLAQLSAFTFGNGFWNSQESPDAVSTLMASFLEDVGTDLENNGTPGIVLFDADGNIATDRHGNVLTTVSLPITLYEETTLLGNTFRWIADTWFGCNFLRDEIEREFTEYFDLIKLNQERFGLDPNMPLVHFAHSGDFQPLVEALEHMPDEYRSQIGTVVAYGAPYVGDGIVNDPYLQTLIRVTGSEDAVPFVAPHQFQMVDQNGNTVAIPNQYNIVIKGANHNDYSYDPSFDYGSPEEAEIARKTSLFMRELTLKADNLLELQDFLNVNRPDGSISVANGTYEVDILKFQSGLSNA